ncbi:hypothetical protein NDU88_005325 [Pleurodeles waltl]|uniref:Uncharacterized protein n=1 Tax=Pleurodeles waltl TaxID=8319 RepID=A0AAV7MA66_PLEWA|nr:hypothetical protein NDU88_005325 [Pleurodeles waltl]
MDLLGYGMCRHCCRLNRLEVLLLWTLLLSLGNSSVDVCRGLSCSISEGESEPQQPRHQCAGGRCPGGRANRPSRSFHVQSSLVSSTGLGHQLRGAQGVPHQQASLPDSRASASISYSQQQTPVIQALSPPQQPAAHSEQIRQAASSVEAACVGADCPARPSSNISQECRGIECRLPLRIRLKPRPRLVPCVGEGCPAADSPTMVRVADRAAQFIGDVTDFTYPGADFGGATLGVQLTCDIKPGENEVPSEDALILQLQLAKGQEKFVEMLRNQQKVIADLQQRLTEQQSTLINQQQEILNQQRKMYEQMDVVKAQYGMLFDTVKQMSFQSLQDDIQHYFEAHLQGLQNQARNHLQKSFSVQKVDVDAKVFDVGPPMLDCGICEDDEFCDFQKTPSQCEKCTLCPAGFFQMTECSANADRICQDRDECFDSPNICGERIKCLNTPGGFRCLGVAERDAVSGLCGDGYFFNKEMEECQACAECEHGMVTFACSGVSDTVCSHASETKLSECWMASVSLPSAKTASAQVYTGLNMKIKEKVQCDILSTEDSRLVFRQHGLVWVDLNFAVKHNCRNFLQLSLKLNNSEEGYELSGVRIEQPDGKYYQSTTLSSAAEVEPSHALSVFLKSPNQFCNQSKDLNAYELNTPLSLFWLSHDTGAVAMSAQMSTAMHYQTNYRPTFKITSVSDPYMITSSHDGRSIKFTETGVVKFVFQQALYSMGHTCVHEGFSLVSYISRNGTNSELMQVYKSGVNYRDTSISASGATKVNAGDMISFEILSPAQCNVRYFGENSGISMLSLIWIPTAVSAALSATVSSTGLPTGAVRNKCLHFSKSSAHEKQIQLVTSGQFAQKYFLFTERGTASVSFNLKVIYSCNIIKLTLNAHTSGQVNPTAIAQQIGGQIPEGSIWTTVSLRSSFEVLNGTMISISLDCVRGRINQIAHELGTSISILWISS